METVDYSMLRKSEFGPPGQMRKQFPRIGIQSEASQEVNSSDRELQRSKL